MRKDETYTATCYALDGAFLATIEAEGEKARKASHKETSRLKRYVKENAIPATPGKHPGVNVYKFSIKKEDLGLVRKKIRYSYDSPIRGW